MKPKIDTTASTIWRERVSRKVSAWIKVEKAKTMGINNIFCRMIPKNPIYFTIDIFCWFSCLYCSIFLLVSYKIKTKLAQLISKPTLLNPYTIQRRQADLYSSWPTEVRGHYISRLSEARWIWEYSKAIQKKHGPHSYISEWSL